MCEHDDTCQFSEITDTVVGRTRVMFAGFVSGTLKGNESMNQNDLKKLCAEFDFFNLILSVS